MLINPSQSSQRKASFPAGNTDRFTEKKKKGIQIYIFRLHLKNYSAFTI